MDRSNPVMPYNNTISRQLFLERSAITKALLTVHKKYRYVILIIPRVSYHARVVFYLFM